VRRRAKLAPIVARTVGEERGTVNFIAIDRAGDIASAVSTSGWAYKYPGRIGDSPIIGAGNYCDTRYGGACCTGFGELAIRNLTAKTAVDRLASGMSAAEVARRAIADVNELDDAAFNIVVLAADGTHAAASNRADRRYAWMTAAMTEPATAARTLVARAAGG
jgi:beta-aspartyl-peptidase (threonine type)